jgi:hypothetical protein
MDGDCALFGFYCVQEIFDDVILRTGTICEVKFHVLYAVLGESFSFVLFLVESDNQGDSELFEDRDVVFGCESSPLKMKKGTEAYSFSIF